MQTQRPYSLGLELAYNTDLPIPHPDDLNPKEGVVNRQDLRSCRQKWLLAVLIFVGILSISIGLSVGIPTRSSSSSSSSSSSVLDHGAMNDTSLSAIQDADGNRHVFFQDLNGTLCHVLFSRATNRWAETVDFIPVERQPRNLTPISVVTARTSLIATYFNIFYIDTANTIAAFQYAANQSLLLTQYPLINSTFSTLPDTRSLSILEMNTSTESELELNGTSTVIMTTCIQYLLVYQRPTKEITVLNGFGFNFSSGDFGDYSVSSWNWNNASTHSKGLHVEGFGPSGGPFSLTKDPSVSSIQPYFAYFHNSQSGSAKPYALEIGFSSSSELGKTPFHLKHV